MRIYYTKPPVLMFGFLFPLFMFLAFYLGRSADLHTLFPGLAAMFVFFVASSVGPLITPWEKRAGTYERLLSFPVTVNTLILGDVVAGMLYGIIINVIILAAGTAAFGYAVSLSGVFLIAISLLLGAFCFSALGVLLASPASTNPSNVMMLSSLVRFPLIFISGIFVPIASLQGVARVVVYCSPIT
jgi:ABC-2 type transport system permease protein